MYVQIMLVLDQEVWMIITILSGLESPILTEKINRMLTILCKDRGTQVFIDS